jgi:glutamate-1-semialdehyde aminotransferase
VTAAADAALTKVLTPAAYEGFEATNRLLLDGCQRIIEAYGLPAYAEGFGAKGSIVFAAERIYDYRDYLVKVDAGLSRLAWLYHINHGNLITPGTETDWTLSVAHAAPEVERYLEAFERFAADVTAR